MHKVLSDVSISYISLINNQVSTGSNYGDIQLHIDAIKHNNMICILYYTTPIYN